MKKLLLEKLLLINNGERYGQIVFLSGGGGCFVGETLVHAENGYKKISDIIEGEKVWTFNEQTGTKELKPVLQTVFYSAPQVPLIELEFENGDVVVCTEDHEFLIDGQWIKAKDL